jgi:hypothetical protein
MYVYKEEDKDCSKGKHFRFSTSFYFPFTQQVSESHSHYTKFHVFSRQANYTGPSDRRLSAKLVPTFADRNVAWSAQRIPTAVNLVFLKPEPLLFHSSSSSFILARLSGSRCRPTTSQKIG